MDNTNASKAAFQPPRLSRMQGKTLRSPVPVLPKVESIPSQPIEPPKPLPKPAFVPSHKSPKEGIVVDRFEVMGENQVLCSSCYKLVDVDTATRQNIVTDGDSGVDVVLCPFCGQMEKVTRL